MANDNAIFQNGWYIGNQLNCILYGIELALYFVTVRLILDGRKKKGPKAESRLLYLSTFFLIMTTVYVAIQGIFGEEMWIVNEGYPGGSAQYFATHAAVWYETFGTTCGILMNLGSDWFQIYRMYIVWEQDYRAIIIPSIVYLASAVLGVLTAIFSGLPNANFFAGFTSKIVLAYTASTIGVNAICSVAVCAHILYRSRSINTLLGQEAGRTYTGALAVIVECMVPYVLIGLIYLVMLGLQNPLSIVFLSLYSMFMCLSPQMVILRVLMGRAVTVEIMKASSLRFGGTSEVVTLADSSGAQLNGSQVAEGTADRVAIRLNALSLSDLGLAKSQKPNTAGDV